MSTATALRVTCRCGLSVLSENWLKHLERQDRGPHKVVPGTFPFHCANDCPVGGSPTYGPEEDGDLFPCGWRHWCPWCGDCEYCYDVGPHSWD